MNAQNGLRRTIGGPVPHPSGPACGAVAGLLGPNRRRSPFIPRVLVTNAVVWVSEEHQAGNPINQMESKPAITACL
jgi:hypothetical protein